MQCKAIVQQGSELAETRVSLPEIGAHQVLIRVQYAALNPTDVLAFDLQAFGDGAILGCDFAGLVEEVGADVTKFAAGDKVASFVWGGEIRGVGAFSELCIAEEALTFKVPSNVTLEQAATIPLSAMTAWLALFSSECLNLKDNKGPEQSVLIIGGSSSVGSFANQLGKSYGIRTLSTCSQKNIENVRQDGAALVFDYNDADYLSKIQESCKELQHVFDTIGTQVSTTSAGQILEKDGGTLCTVRPGKAFTEGLAEKMKVCDVFVFTVFPKEHDYRGKLFWPINPENCELGRQFCNKLPDLLSQGQLRPRPVKSMGRLTTKTLAEGIDLLRSKKVSNEKVCFTVLGEI